MTLDYQKIYNKLMSRAETRVLDTYSETHHVIPKCLGGGNSRDNLVQLTPEEHYVAHQLLVRIYPNDAKLTYAAIMMCSNRPSNKLYGWLRRRLSGQQSQKMKNGGSPTKGKMWVSNSAETILVEGATAAELIASGAYIRGKVATIATCGHLVRLRCVPCDNLKRKSYDDKRGNFKEIALQLYNNFMDSNYQSVTQFAKDHNTSQPRLSSLWLKYIPEYSANRRHGKKFKP